MAGYSEEQQRELYGPNPEPQQWGYRVKHGMLTGTASEVIRERYQFDIAKVAELANAPQSGEPGD